MVKLRILLSCGLRLPTVPFPLGEAVELQNHTNVIRQDPRQALVRRTRAVHQMPVACSTRCKARTRTDEGATLRQPVPLEGSDDSFHRTPRIHHAGWRRGGRLACRFTGAAAITGDWISEQHFAERAAELVAQSPDVILASTTLAMSHCNT